MSYFIPWNVEEAAVLAHTNENIAYLAGGTDLMVRQSLGLESAKHIIDLSKITDLRGIAMNDEELSIGAATTLAELASNSIIQTTFPALAEAALSIASPPIRNSATVGGNLLCENRCIYYDQSEFWQEAAGGCLKCGAEVCIATGSAKQCYSVFISDLAPVLICLDAYVEILHHSPKPVEALYTGDGLNPLTISKRDIVTRIVIPMRGVQNERTTPQIFFQKHRPRASVDFTNLTVAMRRTIHDDITIAASGIGPRPAVLRNATSENADVLTTSLLKQSKIIDNLSYRRPYRKEMLGETIAEGIATLRKVLP
ncbi:MAG TPA: FAD binding domain-containing protein [Candidatus Kapabacteria bacterium]|nr:FAD binding domain-containing protein [Candidatus Kapabacteria bacterium]